MTRNNAAWLVAEKERPFVVKEAPDANPLENEVLVENHAVAINPVDGYVQTLAFFPMQYPTILGHDVAGEVVAVGSGVTRFKEGDRAVGHALGVIQQSPRASAFQSYTILESLLVSKIPDSITYEQAAVLPCCLSMAASGLFLEAPFLQMQYPTEPARESTGQTVLVYGGASSVGSNAIQLAVAAGYEVITTASPKNFDYVKTLGATQAFDYTSASISEELARACQGKQMAGALDCIGDTAVQVCMKVMQKVDGNRAVATVKPEPRESPDGVTVKHIFGPLLKDGPLGPAIWQHFLPKALESGSMVPAPKPLVAGKGLDKLQDALDLMEKGVSAQKIVLQL